ncbi:Cleavage polyadenylation factor [Salix suchowensis]|nr:Cleavage polyadenylation factor [Salix suchowensis]
MDSAGTEIEQREWTLSPETEYRFELDPGTTLAIKATPPQSMSQRKRLCRLMRISILPWSKCEFVLSKRSMDLRLRMSNPEYIQNPESACRRARKLRYNLHIKSPGCKGAWAIPGTLSAAPVSAPIATYSPSNPLGAAATSAPMAITSNALLPLVYWYGHGSIGKNPLLFERLIRNLGHVMDDKWDLDAEVNVILVVGHEKLNVELQRAYGSQLTVVKIPKSGGVGCGIGPELSRTRLQLPTAHIHVWSGIRTPPGVTSATIGGEAPSDFILSPSSTVCKFEDLMIYRIGAETMAPTSALPIGATRAVSEMQPVRIEPSQPGSRLQNAILAVLISPTTDENERYDEEILDLPAMGFLVVYVFFRLLISSVPPFAPTFAWNQDTI